jgi:colanic acid/amylovoran biosynthesis glycosyltransferase
LVTTPTLLVVPSLTAQRNAAGKMVLTRKYLSGLEEYASLWPGKVVSAVRATDEHNDSLDLVEVGEGGVEIREAHEDVDRIDRQLAGATVVLVGDDRYARVVARRCLRAGIPYVHTLEWDAQTRRQIIWQSSPSLLRGGKRILWAEVEALSRYRSMKLAAGLQCNGTPSYDEYRRLNPRTLLYFDSRVTADMVVGEAALARRLERLERGEPLRLVFSGRLIPIKGADHLPRLARALADRQVPFTLDICGGGSLERAISEQSAALGVTDRVRLRGTLDFERELMPFVADNADVFVCCHLQGDPSCTYLETMACGVPIAGYGNVALEGLIRRVPFGWAVAPFRPEPLADVIAQLHRDRSLVSRAARAARVFAAANTFEQTMATRIDHLLACSGVEKARRQVQT